ncbi:MAG: nuclear transport factor 2 family protein [Cyanobacteria bacterium P01_E01_bin.42]
MDEKAAVLAVNEAFYRAFEKRDIGAMSAVWSQGTWSSCVHPGWETLRGWEDTRNSWEQIFKNTSYLEIDTEIINVDCGEAIAYVVLVENVMQIVGSERYKARSMATNVFRKMAQKWYLVHHHGSPVASR